MAPVYVACRLMSLLLCAIFVLLSTSNCYSLLVYDRQLLLDIRDSFVAKYNPELKSSVAGSQSCSPNSTWDIPEYLSNWPHGVPRRKRRRRRGKRGGVAVKLKMALHTGRAARASSFVSMTTWNLGVGRCAGWRLLDPPARWLRTIFQDSHSTIPCYPPIRVRRCGANLQNLRSLNRVFSPAISESGLGELLPAPSSDGEVGGGAGWEYEPGPIQVLRELFGPDRQVESELFVSMEERTQREERDFKALIRVLFRFVKAYYHHFGMMMGAREEEGPPAKLQRMAYQMSTGI
ncbi:unnamed protein product [Leuciscus chuanchicus]